MAGYSGNSLSAAPHPTIAATPELITAQAFVKKNCATCHSELTKFGTCKRCHQEHDDLALADFDLADVGAHAEEWEKVVVKLRAGLMPPLGGPRPDPAAADRFRFWLSNELDNAAAVQPDPGPSPIFRRLNRSEYQNAIRDLLQLDVDAARYLPTDDSSHGFDNMAGTLRASPLLMERYLAAAKTISRLAIGSTEVFGSRTYHVGTLAERRVRTGEMPLGAEGGSQIRHYFPRDGEYELTVSLGLLNRPGARRTIPVLVDRQLEITIDGVQVGLFTVEKPEGEVREPPKFHVRVPVTAGSHNIAARFYKMPLDLVDGLLEPLVNQRGEGDIAGANGAVPRLSSLKVDGPFNAGGPGDTPSRRAVFVCQPTTAETEAACAQTILAKLARRAFRATSASEEIESLVQAYAQVRARGESFEAGIEFAVRRLLVSPHFLFRIEVDTQSSGHEPGLVSDIELASRLSFFLWSSIPDEPLLAVAEQGRLHTEIERQVRRMLDDPRAWAMTANFASQWLELRSLAFFRPTEPFSLHYDEALRDSLQRETELFVDYVIQQDRPVAELITARYTFLNKRLADHYGIPGVQHPDLRRVDLPQDSPRGGLLGHGSLLAITSHPDRTSPVLRGKWVLTNLLGTPPPPPPDNVPALEAEKPGTKAPTLREQLSEHRANPACASCHDMIDPAGFALENFDAIGRWRDRDNSWNPIDSAAVLPDGTRVRGVDDLKRALVAKPERFATTIAERLLTYALGRGIEYYDAPSVRKIVSESAKDEYRIRSLIVNVARSYPFVTWRSESAVAVKRDADSGEVTQTPTGAD